MEVLSSRNYNLFLRFAAAIIDIMVFGCAWFAIFMLEMHFAFGRFYDPLPSALPVVFVWLLFEAINGRSPGYRAAGLKLALAPHYPQRLLQVLIRNVTKLGLSGLL